MRSGRLSATGLFADELEGLGGLAK